MCQISLHLFHVDFDQLYQKHSEKNSLQGQPVSIREVYVAETLVVSYVSNKTHTSITVERLQEIFGENSWQEDVFACVAIHDENSAEIEMMNAEGYYYFPSNCLVMHVL